MKKYINDISEPVLTVPTFGNCKIEIDFHVRFPIEVRYWAKKGGLPKIYQIMNTKRGGLMLR